MSHGSRCHGSRSHGRGAILAAAFGNLLEWYDFSVYAAFAIYIAANFFPDGAPGVALGKAFLVFGLGFVVRPLGVVIGLYGDHADRKAALTTTILLMAAAFLVEHAPPGRKGRFTACSRTPIPSRSRPTPRQRQRRRV